MKIYAGIGSRQTPRDVLARMTTIGRDRAAAGWTLRSGGADGADAAFEAGCDAGLGRKEIFLPWNGFNASRSPLYPPTAAAVAMAASVHPNWAALSPGGRLLHARNCHQVMGEDLESPVDELVCWTEGGADVGETRTAIVLARRRGIRVTNLWKRASC